jgi:hypothetical protein
MDRKVFTRVTNLEQNHVHILKNGQVHFSYSPPSEDRLSNLIPTKYNMDTSFGIPLHSTRLNYKQDEHINFGQVDVLHRFPLSTIQNNIGTPLLVVSLGILVHVSTLLWNI